MAKEQKQTIIEGALVDLKAIKSTLEANTKEILRSVMKEEINGYVKESLNEADFEEEDIEDDEEGTSEESPIEGDDEALEADTEELENGTEDLEGDVEDLEADTLGDDSTDMDALGMDDDMDDLDLTGASDEEVIAIYKKLSGEDEIEVVSDNEIKLNIQEPGEYIVKLGEKEQAVGLDLDNDLDLEDELGTGDELGLENDSDEESYEDDLETENVYYEIELPTKNVVKETKDIESTKAPVKPNAKGDVKNTEGGFDEKKKFANAYGKGSKAEISESEDDEETEKEPIEEAIPVGTAEGHRLPGKAKIGQPKGAGADIKEAVVTKYNTLITESKQLKKQNEEFRNVLHAFRKQLDETVVFNANLSYVVKLFTEHTTNKEEKNLIIKRFDDSATTLKESKQLYKTIVNELSSKKSIAESVEGKLDKTLTSGQKTLTESTVYADKGNQRIIELMRINKQD